MIIIRKRGVSMKFKKLLISAGIFAIFAMALVGCGNTKPAEDNQKEIKIGATAGPHAEVVEAVAKEAKKQGINVKVVEFTDYITPDKALASGDIDLDSYQHLPFLQNFNKQNNSDLVPITNTILMRMGIYSDKVHDIKDIPKGGIVAIPNDPTNGGRGLMLLQKAGVIKLKDGVGFKATVSDIAENPKNLQFKELEAAQLPRSLADVDAAVITMNYVMSAGLDVNKQGIFLEAKDEPLAVMVLAARNKDKDNATYKKIAEIFHSAAVKQFIADKYKGTIVPAE
jgi:ABC-type metal ion transport system, periplasmic component/surface antigen